MERIISHNTGETYKLAQRVYRQLRPNIGQKAIIIALEGPLGAGKTTFTKALAQALRVKDVIVSPTFTLHEQYPQFDHVDMWRIEDPQELIDLGLDKMVAGHRLIVIEWAERVKDVLKKYQSQAQIIWIKFEYGKKENERRISYEDFGH